jgi:hypothetical protein
MAVTFNMPPATDPAYLAFLRQTGVQEQDLGAEAAARISSLNRALQRHLPAYADQKRQAEQGVADSYEERGLYRSGGRLRDQVDAGNAVDRNRLEDIANTQDQSAGVNADLARNIADLRRQAAERELATRDAIGHQAPPMSNPTAHHPHRPECGRRCQVERRRGGEQGGWQRPHGGAVERSEVPLMAQIDSFQGAENSADAQKRALLSIIAQQGSAGQAAYKAQQDAAQATASQATQAAAGRAGLIDAPAAAVSQLTAAAAEPGATYGADAQAGARTLSSVTAAGQQANSNYMEQLKAAIPLSRQLSQAYQKDAEDAANRKLWDDTVARNDRNQQRQWDLEDRDYTRASRAEQHQWDLEDRAAAKAIAAAKAAKGASGTGNALADLIKSLGGETLAKTQLNALVNQRLADGSSDVPGDKVMKGDEVAFKSGRYPSHAATRDDVIRQIEDAQGVQPGALAALLAPKATKPTKMSKTISPQMEQTLRNKSAYAEWADQIASDLDVASRTKPPKGERAPSAAAIKAHLAANLRKELGKKQPLLTDLLIRDFLHG